MAIRNTNINEGVAIYKQSVADEVDVARRSAVERFAERIKQTGDIDAALAEFVREEK